MKAIADNIKASITLDNKAELTLSLEGKINKNDIQELYDIIRNGKKLSVELKQFRVKRSIDANAMLWVILDKIAQHLRTSKDEVYLQMLQRYGVFTHIVVKKEAVDRIKSEWKTVVDLGEVTVNNKTGIQLQCYFGSSTYDSKEFSVLLTGVIDEARGMGIEVISEEEKESLIENWGKEK
jgi:hypothetical protein